MVSMSSQEICDLWAQARRVGAARGTWMHAQIECLLNGGCVTSCSVEVAKFLRFVADGGFGSACVFRTEWRIYATDESVAGSIDFVAREPDGSLVLFDWKRARKLRAKDNSFGKFMKSPVSHVPDAALWHYRLQLNYNYTSGFWRGITVCMWPRCMLCLSTLTIAPLLTKFKTCKWMQMLL